MFNWDAAHVLMGFRARFRRESRKITQATMAQFLGCDVRTVSRFENGERPGVNAKVVFGYAAFFREDCDKFYRLSTGQDAQDGPYWRVAPPSEAELASPICAGQKQFAIRAASRFSKIQQSEHVQTRRIG